MWPTSSTSSSSSSSLTFINDTSSPWSTWRQTKPDIEVDLDVHQGSALPTPPSSVPPRKLAAKQKQMEHQQQLHYLRPVLDYNAHLQQEYYPQSAVVLPPIKQINRQSLCPSPLTPPDDETSPFWHSSRPQTQNEVENRHHQVVSVSSSSQIPSPIVYATPYARTPDLISPASDSDSASPLAYRPDLAITSSSSRPDVSVRNQILESRAHEVREQCERERDIEPTNISTVPTIVHPSSVHLFDWLTSEHRRSAHFIAEKACEMICYLWFSNNVVPGHSSPAKRRRAQRQQKNASPLFSSPRSSPNAQASAAMQFNASSAFVEFMQKLLETTQVSQSVIVLSLRYVYRLKEKNHDTVGLPGSEFRVAVVSLMLANKFVDDNTYTNKTWSDVSGISLIELNKMEREFLQGIDFRLFVDKSTYDSWLNLLKGLVLAKERDSRNWRYARRHDGFFPYRTNSSIVQSSVQSGTQYHFGHSGNYGPALSQDSLYHRGRKVSLDSSSLFSRARSTSPQAAGSSGRPMYGNTNGTYNDNQFPFTFNVPAPGVYLNGEQGSLSLSHLPLGASSHLAIFENNESMRPNSSKRSAADAFSPTSSTFPAYAQQRPLKQQHRQRPVSLMLNMEVLDPSLRHQESRSAHPALGHEQSGSHLPTVSMDERHVNGALALDGLQSFEHMSLESSSAVNSRPHSPSIPQDVPSNAPRMLAAPYEYILDGSRRLAPPQNLYFYSLASSPAAIENAARDETNQDVSRKARLRYHQPQNLPQLSNHAYEPQYSSSTYYGNSVDETSFTEPVHEATAGNHPSGYMPLQAPDSLVLPPMHMNSHHQTQHLRAFHPHHTLGVQLPPLVVQSARSSPREGYDRFLLAQPHAAGRGRPVVLPHLRDAMWALPVSISSSQAPSVLMSPQRVEPDTVMSRNSGPPQAEGWDNDNGDDQDVDVELEDSYSPNDYPTTDFDEDMGSNEQPTSAMLRYQDPQEPHLVHSQRTSDFSLQPNQISSYQPISPFHRAHANATPAPFANAGPPGIHFYEPLIPQATPVATPASQYRNVDAMTRFF